MPTKGDLEKQLTAQTHHVNKLELQLAKLVGENQKLKKDLANGAPTYIMVEIGERNFCLGKKIIGTKNQYGFLATCRNRAQSERLLEAVDVQSV